MRLFMVSLVGIFILLMLWLGAMGLSSFSKGYSWEEMDWDQNGSTDLWEFISSGDIGKREIEKNGNICQEYFAFKDGMPVKIVCPSKSN